MIEKARYTLVWGRSWDEGVGLGGDRVLLIVESRVLGNLWNLWSSLSSLRARVRKNKTKQNSKTKHKKEKKSVLFSYATAVFQENQQRMNVSSSIGEGGTLRICLLSEGLLERKVLVSGPELGCLFQLWCGKPASLYQQKMVITKRLHSLKAVCEAICKTNGISIN